MCNLVACAAVFVILQTILEIVAFWSLKAGLSNSAKDKTSRESLLISLQPRAAGVATGIFTWSCYPTPGWWGGSISSATSVAPNLFEWRATFWNPNPWRAKLTTRGGVQIGIFHTFNIVNMLIYIAEQIHDRGGGANEKNLKFFVHQIHVVQQTPQTHRRGEGVEIKLLPTKFRISLQCWRATSNTAADNFWPVAPVLGTPELHKQPGLFRSRRHQSIIYSLAYPTVICIAWHNRGRYCFIGLQCD